MANQHVQIDIEHLTTLAVKGLDGLFFRAPKEKAKKLYKEISDGRAVDFGSLTFTNPRLDPLRLRLTLDHSEFVGHLTFHVFKMALAQTLRHLGQKLQKKQNLNLFDAENGEEIVLLTPGVIRQDDRVNILVLGIVPAPQSATIKLQFLDPEQFKAAPDQAQPVAPENAIAGDDAPAR